MGCLLYGFPKKIDCLKTALHHINVIYCLSVWRVYVSLQLVLLSVVTAVHRVLPVLRVRHPPPAATPVPPPPWVSVPWRQCCPSHRRHQGLVGSIHNDIVMANIWITFKISQKFVPKDPVSNIPSLVQIMAWRRPGDKPLSEPMMV